MRTSTRVIFVFAIAATVSVFLAFFSVLNSPTSDSVDKHAKPAKVSLPARSPTLLRSKKNEIIQKLPPIRISPPINVVPTGSVRKMGLEITTQPLTSPTMAKVIESVSKRPIQKVPEGTTSILSQGLDLEMIEFDDDDGQSLEDDDRVELHFNPSQHVSVSSSNSPSSSIQSSQNIISSEVSIAIQHSCQNQSYLPMCNINFYVRFWRHRFTRPQDCFASPLRQSQYTVQENPEKLKYLLFMPDEGGWNNIRMAAETAIMFGIITGRVIVMPPEEKFYLLDKNHHEDDNKSNFDKFFDLSKIAEVVDIISMKDFLIHVAVKGLLKEPLTLSQANALANGGQKLWSYLERASFTRQWQPGKFFIGFNITTKLGESYLPKSKTWPVYHPEYILGNISTDVTDGGRLERFASHKRQVLPYNDEFHSHLAVFFPGDYRDTHRLLTHFYTYLYFSDPRMERYYKRLVRDRLHYHDEIFCIAGQIVQMLHQKASKIMFGQTIQTQSQGHHLTLGGNTNHDATYFAYHIRRGDFQYDHVRISAEKMWENTKHLLDPLRTKLIYIATDEKNKSFFAPFRQGYEIVFLDDFISKIQIPPGQEKLNRNHIGMIEQVICANAHTFIGTPLSTFTGYITRMRGYYRDGRYARSYYTMEREMFQLRDQTEIKGPFWAREFAVAHHAVDDETRT